MAYVLALIEARPDVPLVHIAGLIKGEGVEFQKLCPQARDAKPTQKGNQKQSSEVKELATEG